MNAFSREAILRAKEIAEERGFHFLHAIVDCMWVKRQGASEEDYQELAAEVSRQVGIDISLEGVYSWILFPSSKMDPKIPTANRYVGWYTSGEIKIRGVEMRRRDTPVFIKRLQGEMLQVFGRARTIGELQQLIPEALDGARQHIATLRKGEADPRELVIRRHITREPEEYTTRTVTSEASQALAEAGIVLAPGEAVEYVVVDATGKRKPEKAKPLALYALEDGYDIDHYTELALKAVETLLLPFGYNLEKLSAEFALPRKRSMRPRPRPHQEELPFAHPS